MGKCSSFWKKALFVAEVMFVVVLIFAFVYVPKWQAEEKVNIEMADVIDDIENLEKNKTQFKHRLEELKNELDKY